MAGDDVKQEVEESREAQHSSKRKLGLRSAAMISVAVSVVILIISGVLVLLGVGRGEATKRSGTSSQDLQSYVEKTARWVCWDMCVEKPVSVPISPLDSAGTKHIKAWVKLEVTKELFQNLGENLKQRLKTEVRNLSWNVIYDRQRDIEMDLKHGNKLVKEDIRKGLLEGVNPNNPGEEYDFPFNESNLREVIIEPPLDISTF